MRPITDVLREIRRGVVVDEASELLAEVVRATMATGKKGELTIKLMVSRETQNGKAVTITAKVEAKRPRPDMPKAVFFADGEGDLVRDDPDQKKMFADVARTDGAKTSDLARVR